VFCIFNLVLFLDGLDLLLDAVSLIVCLPFLATDDFGGVFLVSFVGTEVCFLPFGDFVFAFLETGLIIFDFTGVFFFFAFLLFFFFN